MQKIVGWAALVCAALSSGPAFAQEADWPAACVKWTPNLGPAA